MFPDYPRFPPIFPIFEGQIISVFPYLVSDFPGKIQKDTPKPLFSCCVLEEIQIF